MMKVRIWLIEATDRRGNNAGRIKCLTEERRDEAVRAFLGAGYDVEYHEVEETI